MCLVLVVTVSGAIIVIGISWLYFFRGCVVIIYFCVVDSNRDCSKLVVDNWLEISLENER